MYYVELIVHHSKYWVWPLSQSMLGLASSHLAIQWLLFMHMLINTDQG